MALHPYSIPRSHCKGLESQFAFHLLRTNSCLCGHDTAIPSRIYPGCSQVPRAIKQCLNWCGMGGGLSHCPHLFAIITHFYLCQLQVKSRVELLVSILLNPLPVSSHQALHSACLCNFKHANSLTGEGLLACLIEVYVMDLGVIY